jgi:cytochrome c556
MWNKPAWMRPSGVIASVAFLALPLAANEKPTKEYQDLMKAGAAIVDLAGSTSFGRENDIDSSSSASLVTHIKGKDYDGIAADAAALRGIFEKIQAFWAAKNVADALDFSKAGLQGTADLEAAAKAKDNAGITAAHFTIANACRSCHLAHRVIILTDRSFQIR